MKYVALLAVIAVVAVQAAGAVPNSSVGGPMTMALIYFSAALAFGAAEAWSSRRGVIGWIVSLLAAFIGAVVAGLAGGTLVDLAMGIIAPAIGLEGSLAETRHPLLYVISIAMMALILFGAWLSLQLVNRMR